MKREILISVPESAGKVNTLEFQIEFNPEQLSFGGVEGKDFETVASDEIEAGKYSVAFTTAEGKSGEINAGAIEFDLIQVSGDVPVTVSESSLLKEDGTEVQIQVTNTPISIGFAVMTFNDIF